MDAKILVCLFAALMLSGTAFAALPTVRTFGDFNQYFPAGSTVQIQWQVADVDDPNDVNMHVFYQHDANRVRVEITSLTGGDLDRNSMNFCNDPISDANQVCTLNWVLPAGFDGNFLFDVNVEDIENSDDLNHVSGEFTIDSNSCLTNGATSGGTVTLTTVCGGLGASATTVYGSSRQGSCPDVLNTAYSDPFRLVFGEHTVCFRSTDTLGNVEEDKSLVFTVDSNAFAIALLAELALAGLLLVAIIGSVVLDRRELTVPLMISLLIAAIIIVLSIIIYAAVLGGG